MTAQSNGSSTVVSFTASDARQFAARWPCSTVRGSGWFEFAANGDLVDFCTVVKNPEVSSGWSEFADDCKAFGRAEVAR